MQQCVTCHDPVLSAATNDNSAAAPARRHVRKCRPLRYLDPRSPLAVTWHASYTTSKLLRFLRRRHRLHRPGTHAPATAHLADGQLWSDLASGVATDPLADGFQIPRYHRKKTAAVKAAPPKATVEKETDVMALKDFMQEEHVKVLEMECVSHIDSWTKSFRVIGDRR